MNQFIEELNNNSTNQFNYQAFFNNNNLNINIPNQNQNYVEPQISLDPINNQRFTPLINRQVINLQKDTVDEKLAKKRKRERESAKRCRERRNKKLKDLEEKVKILSQENIRLKKRKKLYALESLNDKRINIINDMEFSLKTNFPINIEDEKNKKDILKEFGENISLTNKVIQKNTENFPNILENISLQNLLTWMLINQDSPLKGINTIKGKKK